MRTNGRTPIDVVVRALVDTAGGDPHAVAAVCHGLYREINERFVVPAMNQTDRGDDEARHVEWIAGRVAAYCNDLGNVAEGHQHQPTFAAMSRKDA